MTKTSSNWITASFLHPKWWVRAIAYALLLSIAFLLLYAVWFRPMIETKITKVLQDKVANGGTVEMESLDFSLLRNQIWIKKLKLIRKENLAENAFKTTIHEIKVQGIDWWELYFKNAIHLDDILVQEARLDFAGKPFAKDSTADSKIIHCCISNVAIQNSYVTYANSAGTSTSDLQVDSFNIILSNLIFGDTNSVEKVSLRESKIDWKKFKWHTSNKLYTFSVGALDYQSIDKQLQLSDLKFEPRVSQAQFESITGNQKAQVTLRMPALHFQDLDLHQLLQHKKSLDCGLLEIDDFYLSAYKNKNLPDFEKIKTLPQVALMQLELPIQFDTIRVRKGFIEYLELGPDTEEPGRISFEDLYASLYSVTNKKEILSKQKIRVDTRSRFMGEGELRINFQFEPLSSDARYTYQGHLGEFKFNKVNKMLNPRLNIWMESGEVDQLTFDVKANKLLSSGLMDFEYKKLNIHILHKESNRKRKILSAISNGITHQKNIAGTSDYRQGKINSECSPYKGIFGDMWNAVFSGIQSTVLPDILLGDEKEAVEE